MGLSEARGAGTLGGVRGEDGYDRCEWRNYDIARLIWCAAVDVSPRSASALLARGIAGEFWLN